MSVAELARAIVENYCGCRFEIESITDERVLARGDYLVLNKRPIVAITKIVNADDETDEITNYVVFAASGLVRSEDIEEGNEYLVTYSAGYDGVPSDVQLAIDAIADKLSTITSGLKSERLGDYSYEAMSTETIGELPEVYKYILLRYRRIADAGLR